MAFGIKNKDTILLVWIRRSISAEEKKSAVFIFYLFRQEIPPTNNSTRKNKFINLWKSEKKFEDANKKKKKTKSRDGIKGSLMISSETFDVKEEEEKHIERIS